MILFRFWGNNNILSIAYIFIISLNNKIVCNGNNMSEHKLFAQRIGLIGITYVLTTIIRILLIPILTKKLPIEDYGIWVQVNATIGLIPPVVGLGLPFAIVRFLTSKKHREDLQEGFYSISFVVLLTSGIVSLLFLLFSDILAGILFGNNTKVAIILSAILFIQSLIDLPMNYFRVCQRIKRHSFFLILDILIMAFFSSFFIFLGYGILGAVIGLLISKILVFAGMMLFVFREIGFVLPKFNNLKDYLNFGLPLLPSNFSSWIINSSDRYIITIFLGTAFAGYYSPGYTLGGLISMFAAPFSFLLPPVLSKYYDEKKINEFKRVLGYSTKYYLMAAIPSVFGLSILSRPILTVLTTNDIAQIGYMVTPYTAISYLLYGLQGIIGSILIAENRTKIFGATMSLSAIVNFGLNIILVPYMGINGAALTTLISFILIFIIVFYYSSKAGLFNFDLSFIVKSLLSSGIMSLAILYFNPVGMFSLIASVVFGALLYFSIIYILKGIKNDEIQFFRRLVKN